MLCCFRSLPMKVKILFLLAAPMPLMAASVRIEERGEALWPTANFLRFRHADSTPKGRPVWVDADLPEKFNPDSVRVLAGWSEIAIPAKTEGRASKARISWISTGAPEYFVYFDLGNAGETHRAPEPAMVGAGDRVTFGRLGVRGKLAVGLWANPAALDFDYDGNIDLIVSCPDRPYNGTYLFRNLGSNEKPLFDRAEWLGRGHKDMVAADFNGDGEIDLVVSGGYYSDIRNNRMSRFVPIQLPRSYHVGRDDLWYPVDWDGDGRIDIVTGVSDWREYGWDDAFNSRGEWTRGPLHGYVWFHRNVGTNERPVYAEPVALQAGGKPIDQYGSPAPNPVDWFGRGRLDLIVGEFLDRVTLFRNTGGALAAGVRLNAGGKPLQMSLCMIQPRVVSWHPDGRPSLLVAEEDGTVSLVENLAPRGQAPRLAAP